MFSFICTWTTGGANNGEAGDLRRHSAHYDVTVIILDINNKIVLGTWSPFQRQGVFWEENKHKLTYLHLDKMVAIPQMMISDAF